MPTRAERIGSLISLFSILLNLFSPFIQVAQAAGLPSFEPIAPPLVTPLSPLEIYDGLAELRAKQASGRSLTPAPLPRGEGNRTSLSPWERSRGEGTIGLLPPPFLSESSNKLAALREGVKVAPVMANNAALLPGWFDSHEAANIPSAVVKPNSLLPDWFSPKSTAVVAKPTSLLPDWFGTNSAIVAKPNPILPTWFDNKANLPQAPKAGVLPSWFMPPARPLAKSIPIALLNTTISGPTGPNGENVASLGAPSGKGDIYTITIKNNSGETAYNSVFSAAWPAAFSFDSYLGASYSGGSITLTTISGTNAVNWTPAITLTPGQAVTISFKLRAGCDAQSGQQMRAGIKYNATAGAAAVETNDSGLNITTGRGNLVIRKDPALQYFTTNDLGSTTAWTVTVQNTGLGVLYNATITDAGGFQLAQPTGDLNPSVTLASLNINEKRSYRVTGTLAACNFTNVAQASWQCGNEALDGSVITPVKSVAT